MAMAFGHQVENWRKPVFSEDCKVQSAEFAAGTLTEGMSDAETGDKVSDKVCGKDEVDSLDARNTNAVSGV